MTSIRGLFLLFLSVVSSVAAPLGSGCPLSPPWKWGRSKNKTKMLSDAIGQPSDVDAVRSCSFVAEPGSDAGCGSAPSSPSAQELLVQQTASPAALPTELLQSEELQAPLRHRPLLPTPTSPGAGQSDSPEEDALAVFLKQVSSQDQHVLVPPAVPARRQRLPVRRVVVPTVEWEAQAAPGASAAPLLVLVPPRLSTTSNDLDETRARPHRLYRPPMIPR